MCDFYGIDYRSVEVNPLSKKEIKDSTHRKVRKRRGKTEQSKPPQPEQPMADIVFTPFIDFSLPVHCLSLTFHCLPTAFH